jgi:hypothetical protein
LSINGLSLFFPEGSPIEAVKPPRTKIGSKPISTKCFATTKER